MRVLWLSNAVLTDSDIRGSGTWLGAMARRLSQSGEVTLANVSVGATNSVIRRDCDRVFQWLIPAFAHAKHDGTPTKRCISEVAYIVNEFSPDIIHVWGTEYHWGLLTARRMLPCTAALLEMQGLKSRVADVFVGGLSFWEQVSCVGLRELVRASTVWQQQRRFREWSRYEAEIISGHKYIGIQTAWIESEVKGVDGDNKTFHNDLILREPFYTASPWDLSTNFDIFCMAAYPVPFKGLHVAVRALALIKPHFPSARLNIAGWLAGSWIHKDGYFKWIVREIRRLGLEANVSWLGPLDACQIVTQMQKSSVMVIPSFIENCSTSMQEAMKIGIPLVVSHAGGLPSLARDQESALFYSIGDHVACASQIMRLFSDKQMARRLSVQSRQVASQRNDPQRVLTCQIEIYRQIIADSPRYRSPARGDCGT